MKLFLVILTGLIGLAFFRAWCGATRWGLPRFLPIALRPYVCTLCGRAFQAVPAEVYRRARPESAALWEDMPPGGLLAMHETHEHKGVPGPIALPRRRQVDIGAFRVPPERHHSVRQDLMTEAQWRARVIPFRRPK